MWSAGLAVILRDSLSLSLSLGVDLNGVYSRMLLDSLTCKDDRFSFSCGKQLACVSKVELCVAM